MTTKSFHIFYALSILSAMLFSACTKEGTPTKGALARLTSRGEIQRLDCSQSPANNSDLCKFIVNGTPELLPQEAQIAIEYTSNVGIMEFSYTDMDKWNAIQNITVVNGDDKQEVHLAKITIPSLIDHDCGVTGPEDWNVEISLFDYTGKVIHGSIADGSGDNICYPFSFSMNYKESMSSQVAYIYITYTNYSNTGPQGKVYTQLPNIFLS